MQLISYWSILHLHWTCFCSCQLQLISYWSILHLHWTCSYFVRCSACPCTAYWKRWGTQGSTSGFWTLRKGFKKNIFKQIFLKFSSVLYIKICQGAEFGVLKTIPWDKVDIEVRIFFQICNCSLYFAKFFLSRLIGIVISPDTSSGWFRSQFRIRIRPYVLLIHRTKLSINYLQPYFIY